jgi:hypothetical protein
MNPKPHKAGIWEWYDDEGQKRLVDVANIEVDLTYPPYLRVCFWGGYYDVHDSDDEIFPDGITIERKAEWPDRWGNFVGPRGCVPEDDLYYIPKTKDCKTLD